VVIICDDEKGTCRPVCVFCIYLRTNSDLCHLQHKLIGFITEMKSSYSLVRTGSLNKAVCASFLKGWHFKDEAQTALLTFILLMWRIGRAPNSIPIYSYIRQDATLHSLFISGNRSACFGWHFHPSSGAHTTVSTASGICHTVTASAAIVEELEQVWVCCGWRTLKKRKISCPLPEVNYE
jgi:hypothetical protein